MSQNYISNHRYAGWRTIDEGELGEWREYQERQKYNKLSPELQEAFLEMVRRKEREKRPPSN